MIYIKTPTEIEAMQPPCTLASQTLGELAKWIQPGVTTNRLETIAREFIRDNGGTPACLGYAGFPAAVCWEVNETVVHGFPSNYTLREGDILGTDIVVEIDGFNGDMCYTFPVGEISPEVKALCVTTKEALYKGIDAAKEGNRVGDISNTIQTYCESKGYTVVREMCGHGIGRKMHEDPEVPNFGKKSTGPMLRNGMCIAIEPMINLGTRHVIIEKDGWTCRTRDRKPSAHYEHTIAIHGNTPRILTTFSYIEEVLQQRFI
ncbi:MAG: type I methionyl aminopeptidase [Paramuribaculum sp.]|nr:type I methionyl aminopeptidase [Paramuribaculum sp.]